MGERAKEGGRGRGQMGKIQWKEAKRTDVCLGLGRKEEQVYFLSFTYLLIYLSLFLAALRLRCGSQAFSSCGVCRLLIVGASVVAEHRL